MEPLASRIRPRNLDEFVGQEHLLGPGKLLRGLVQSGKLRSLAVTSRERWPAMPDVPTMTELGYKDLVVVEYLGWYAPAKTPMDLVRRVNAAAQEGLATPELAEVFARTGLQLTEAMDPDILEQALAAGFLAFEGPILRATQEGRLRLDALLGALGALAGMVLSFGGAWGLIHFVFKGSFTPAVGAAAAIAMLMMGLAVTIGLATSRDVFRETPMAALREN